MAKFLSEEYYNKLDFIPDFLVAKNGERFQQTVEFIKIIDDNLEIIFEDAEEMDEEADVDVESVTNNQNFVIPLKSIVAADFDTKADVITLATNLNSDKISISSSELPFIKSFAEFLSNLLQVALPADYNDPKYNKDETEDIDIEVAEEDDEEDDDDDEEEEEESESDDDDEEEGEDAPEEMEN